MDDIIYGVPIEDLCKFYYKGRYLILQFRADTFAPGVWAGTEGFQNQFKNRVYKIVRIDFKRRQVIWKRVA